LSLRNILMVSQLAGSLALLVILGLLSLGIQTTMGIQAGFNPRNLYLISLDPIRDGYSGAQAADFFQKLLDRLKRLPSVTAASLTETVPVSMAGSRVTFSTPAAGASNSRAVESAIKHVVGKDYFDTTGIRILLGRGFRKEDEANGARAVIVSEELVREFWNAEDPVGRRIEIGSGAIEPPNVLLGSYDYRPAVEGRQVFEVVGVASDVTEGLVVEKPQRVIYFPLRTADYARPSLQGVTLMVRATPGVDALAAVRREISAMNTNITLFNSRSMAEHIAEFMAPLRIAAWTYGLIGVFGLILAAVGLAGVTAYSVTQRRREIGIRMALGARSNDVLGLVMKEGLVLVTAGTIIGMACAWAGARLLSAMNSSVGTVTSTSASDPVVLYGAPVLLAGLALVACYVPARKSMRIDPAVALRQE
jgi:predicted permease